MLMLSLVPVFAAKPAAAAPAPRTDTYTFAFRDADIAEAAQEVLGATLGVPYTVDPAVTGKISFRIDQRLTRAQLLEAFEAALAANGVVMVRNGDALVLTLETKARGSAAVRMANEPGPRAGFEIVAVPLSFATPTEVAKALEGMGRQGMVVYADDKLGLLLLGGTPRELEAVQQTLRVLDQSGMQSSHIRWVELRQAPAATVAHEVDLILKGSALPGAAVVPLTRLNGLLLIARTPQALDEIASWVDRLDVASKDEPSALWVYHPVSASADALASTLNSVLGVPSDTAGPPGAAPAAPGAGLAAVTSSALVAPMAPIVLGGPPSADSTASAQGPSSGHGGQGSLGEDTVRVGVNRETNSLIVTAPASRWIQIRKMLEEIDRTPSQVLIEASILEVTLGDNFRFGVDWSAMNRSGKLTITSSNNDTGAVAAEFPGFAVTYIDNNIKAAVDALQSVTSVEVVSAPKLVTLDNHVAKLQVGDQVPITTRSAQSTTTADAPLVTTTEYRDTGIILNVTPRISGDNQIILDVDQEVSSVARTTSSDIDSPTIQQRRVSSTLVLKDGGTIALGGLISSSRSRGNSGLPIVKDIPLIGAAFKSTTNDRNRTELIVLMTGKIMRDAAAAERVMAELEADMKEIEIRGLIPH